MTSRKDFAALGAALALTRMLTVDHDERVTILADVIEKAIEATEADEREACAVIAGDADPFRDRPQDVAARIRARVST